ASDGNAIFLDSAGYFLDFIEMPMAIYHWATGTYIPWMATDWKLTPTTFTVHLRKTSNLSDGSVFTSRDVLTTFNVKRLLSDQVWSYIDKVTAPDAHTVVFHMSTPATVVQYLVLRMNIRADSTYSHFGTQVQQLVNAGKTMDSPEAKALRLELNQYRPAAMVACGPFKFDPNSQITSGQITLVKNIGCWAANQVQFDKIVDYNGETAAITPLILKKDIDYATQAFPPDTERAIISKGIGIVRPPLGSGPAIYINFKKVPDLVSAQARQALAYAINRDQAATVSLGLSAKSCKYMAGISDSLAGGWVDSADLAKLNNYALDVAKAASMLTTLGFKKGSDGVYVGPSGAKMDFTLEVPAEYTDWSATAQNVAEQLTAFGFKITVKPVTYTQE
ncbi:MAG: ABC transporter substrate-binding protein, partial [Chloroflexota bacterium]